GGAFVGLEEVIVRRLNEKSLGFGADIRSKKERRTTQLLASVLPEDLIKFGLIPEFVGRLPVVATLEELDEEALVTILTQPRNALSKQYARLFEMETVDLELREAGLRAVARKPMERKTGARGLRTILENVLLDIMYDLPSLKNVSKVVVDETVILGHQKPYVVYKSETATTTDDTTSPRRVSGAGLS